jgi:hypothetical protein
MDFGALDPHLAFRRFLFAQRSYLRLALRADDQDAAPSDLDATGLFLRLT